MKLKPSALDISEDDPFKNDVLERKSLVESLTALVSDVDPPFVLCVESSWGTGKTTFFRLWQAHIKMAGLKNVSVLYFNAWETDFAADPLVAFVGEVIALAKSKVDSNKAVGHIEAIKSIGSKIARRALPAAIKVATAGLLDASDFTEDVAAEAAADLVGDAIDEYEKNKNLIDQFHTALAGLVNELPHDGGGPRLLVFVDELDRCKPSYALSLLERIKHLFNAHNVVFVLALDKRQLCASVEAAYGGRIDSEDYLRRFIDLEVALKASKSPKEVRRFAEYLSSQFSFKEIFKDRTGPITRYDFSNIVETFVELAVLFNLSLRIQEQCFTRFAVAVMSTPKNLPLYPELLVLLSVMRAVDRGAYENYVSNSGTATDLLKCIELRSGGQEFLDSRSGLYTEAVAIAAKMKDFGQGAPPELLRYQELANNDSGTESKRNKESERAAAVLECIRNMGPMNRPRIGYVVEKIELAKEVI